MLFLCYPRCSTCKKAQAWLDQKGLAYQWRDIAQDNPTKAELRAWWQKSGLDLGRFFNTSGMAYRAQNLAQRRPAMSEEEQLELLASDGLLVKRPILVGDDFVLVGFRLPQWEEKLG